MEILTVKSNFDQLPLSVAIATPKQPKAIVQIVHGMCEHKERYFAFMDYLVGAGFAVIIHDQRGHGQSVLSKDDLGYFYQDGATVMIEDTYQLTQLIKARFNDLPLFLMGHSMGSFVVRCYLDRYKHAIDGLLVCGSPSYNRLAKLGKLICLLMQKIKGDHYRSQMIAKMSIGLYNRNFTIPNEWICSDSRIVDQFNQDELCNFNFTVNGYYNLLDLMIRTYRKRLDGINSDLPVLFISGRQDPCIVNPESFIKAVNQFRHCGYLNVVSILFDDMRHEILNETNKEEVYTTIVNYLNRWTNDIGGKINE